MRSRPTFASVRCLTNRCRWPSAATESTATALGRVRRDAGDGDGARAARGDRGAGACRAGRDLGAEEAAAALRSSAEVAAPVEWARMPAETVGRHPLRDGRVAVGVGLAFGHAEARSSGICAGPPRVWARPAWPARKGASLLVIGMPEGSAGPFAESAKRLGFVVRPDDPRRNVVACAGAPACAAAEMPARTIAPAVTEAAGPLLDGSLTLHLSGCAKGCAHPGAATLAFVGAAGECGLVVDGSAQAEPARCVPAGDACRAAWPDGEACRPRAQPRRAGRRHAGAARAG